MKRYLLVIFSFLYMTLSCNAQHDNFKALFILNVTNFIEWPSLPEQFVIKILGNSPVKNILETDPKLRNKKISGIPFKVNEVPDIYSVRECQILYIPSDKLNEISAVMDVISGQPTLIITDDNTGTAIKNGACINFYAPPGQKITMQINKENIINQGLKVDSHLLYLGEVID